MWVDREQALQNDSVVMRFVVRRIDQCYRASTRQRPQPVEFRSPLRQFPCVAPLKFRPALRVVIEPFAQLGARRDVFHPFVDCRVVLPYSARPQPVDQYPRPVVD